MLNLKPVTYWRIPAFALQTDLNTVFIKNNNEAIFQLQIVNMEPYATFEGFKFVPEFRTRDYDSATIADNLQYFIPRVLSL